MRRVVATRHPDSSLARELERPLGRILLGCETALRLLHGQDELPEGVMAALAEAAEAASRASEIVCRRGHPMRAEMRAADVAVKADGAAPRAVDARLARAVEPAVYLVDGDRRHLDVAARCLRLAALGEIIPFQSPEAFLEDYDPIRPGCVVAELRMPGLGGMELASRLRARPCPPPVVFVTGHGDVPMAVAALRQGAVDFLEKPFVPQALIDSVNRALAQDRRQRERASEHAVLAARYATLTRREREVFERLVANEPAKRIALALEISPRTVEHHREHVMAKMGAASRHDLVVMAIVLGRLAPHRS